MKKKLNLDALDVKSFQTNLKDLEVKGGARTWNFTFCHTACSCPIMV